MKILKNLLTCTSLCGFVFTSLLVGDGITVFTDTEQDHEHEEIHSHSHADNHGLYFDDINLNPSQRIDLLKTELYPELYSSISQQNLSNGYKFPFSGPSYSYVTQGYFGPFSHQSVRAVDFFGNNLKVAAARKGVVISANFGGKWDNWCNSYQDCYNKGGIWNGNHVLIQHGDGTYAMYLHMKSGTLRPGIAVGTAVRQGTILGDFGGTGYTCGNAACTTPGIHLHFQTNSGPGVTISTPFEDCNEAINLGDCDNGIPRASTTYTSFNYPPGVESYGGVPNQIFLYGTTKSLESTSNNTLILNTNQNSSSQWLLNPETGRIEGANNRCLVDNGSSEVRVNECDNNNNQQWTKEATFNLRNNQSGRCLQSQSGNLTGSMIILSSCSQNNPNQYFRSSSTPYPVLTKPFNQ